MFEFLRINEGGENGNRQCGFLSSAACFPYMNASHSTVLHNASDLPARVLPWSYDVSSDSCNLKSCSGKQNALTNFVA